MSKRFKLRIARVLPSFHSCRSQDVVPMPSISAPSASSSSSLIKRHVSSALVSVGCRFRSSSSSSSSAKSNRPEVAAAAAPDPTPTSDFQWQKDEKWHVIAKVPAHHRRRKISSHLSSSSSSDDEYFSKHNTKERGGKTRARKKPKKKNKILRRKKSFVHRSSLRFSSSSLDNYCWFSSSERECGFIHDEFLETRTLVSSNSRSFSSSSSDGGKEEANPATRRKELRLRCPSPETESPARMSVFRRMVGCGGREEGKVKESFAVVKRSEDPYGDFRRSMLEMIVEKEMYEKEDLEQLLHCFLSLNSRAHHPVIVQAFSEIWETLFSGGRQV